MNPNPDSGLWMFVTHSAFPIVVDAVGKSFLLMGAMCLVILCMKRCSAAARHLAWFLAVVSLLALPLLSLALPGWRVLPAWMNISDVAGAVVHSPSAPVPSVSAPVAESGLPVPGRSAPVESASVTSIAPASVVSSASAPTMNDRSGLATSGAIYSVGFVAWMIGSALALLPALLGMISLWHLGRGARRETASSWLELLGRLLACLRIRRRVELLRSSRRPMPMTWGVVHPKLLLPEEAQEWSDERRRVVLLHELAHARRWDYLTNLVTQLVCALYWFNPLVWLAARRMITERERACDDIVLTQGASPADYAEQVLHIAVNLRTGRFAGAMGIAMARQSMLEGRLLAILDGTRSRAALTRVAVVTSLAAMIAVVAPVAMTKAAQSAPEDRNGSLSGGSSITAHVLGTDGKPCNASVTFWRAVETTAPAEPTVAEFWDLSNKTMRWRDTVHAKTWEPIRHVGTSPDAMVADLEPGDYRVTAEMGHGPAPFGVSDVIRVDDARSTRKTTIRLEAGPSLTVSGIETATQQSVSGLDGRAREGWFVVALTRTDGLPIASWSGSRWSGPKKQDGVVRFDQLQPGKYRLIAYCPAYLYGRAECVSADGPMEIEMLPGQNREIAVPLKRVDFSEEEIRLRWPFVAQGRVTDELGQAIEGAYVQVHCGMGTLWQTGETRSGADGRYTLRFRGGVNSETGRAARQVASIGVSKSGFVEAGRQPQGGLMMDGDPAAGAKGDSHLILPDKPFDLDFVIKLETKTTDAETTFANIAASSDGARLRELLVGGKWDEALKLARPAARCLESHNQSEGFIQTSSPVMLDWDMCVAGTETNSGAAQRPHIYQYPWLEFSQKPDGLFATLHLRYQSWPKTAWKVRLQRVDRDGAAVVVHRQDEKVLENSGNIMKVPSIDESEVVFHLGDDPVFRPSPGMLYMVSIETLSTEQGNPVRWGEAMPLSLDLATPEVSRVFHGESLTLTRADGKIVAKAAASILSYPRCGWRLSLDLTDDAGKSLISAGTYAENSGEIRRVPELAHMEFPITIPADAAVLDAARRWTLRVERVSGPPHLGEGQPQGAL